VVVAASKKKDVRLIITLECTEQKESGVAVMSRYMTEKVSAAPARPRTIRNIHSSPISGCG
jgi:ribosomal protein L33